VAAERDTPSRPITVEEMLVVNAVDRERRIDVARAAALVQKGEAAARAVLERLVETVALEGRREHGARAYMLSAATYRALGAPSAHTRLRGIEPIQQEQMVLQYVRAHGSITRSAVADLCQLGSVEARLLLRRLLRRGVLESRRERRATTYVLPAG